MNESNTGPNTASWMADRTGRPTSESRHVDVVGVPATAIGELFAVVVEDRHTDVDVELWADQSDAYKRAVALAHEGASEHGDVIYHELNQAMVDDGWVAYLTYSGESDSVRVLRRPVRN